jgi:imidazolonepropionase-like amidohydrolase
LLLPSCAIEPPSAPVAAAASLVNLPTVQPSVTPPPVGQPTIQPSVTPPPAEPTAAPIATATPVAPLPRYDLLLTGGTLIDATGAAPLPDAEIAILGGRIVAIGQAGQIAHSPDTPVRDLSGATVMPGFIDAHVHVSGLSEDDLRRWTRAGVTTVRDLAGPLEERVPLRDSIRARNDPSLPRLLVSGPIVTVAGGYPLGVVDNKLRVAGIIVSGPDDARAKINALADAGVDQIKIAVSGRTDVSWPELSDAEIAAIAETARARGLPISAHVDRASALRRAVLNGISDAAHSPRDRVSDEVIGLMVQRGVGMVPSIAVYEGLARSRGKAVEWRRLTLPVMYDNLRRFAAAGGTLALGADYGGVPGMTIGMPMEEIGHWIAAGLSPQQVIEAGTRGSAAVAGLGDELGTVEPGKIADLLVVQGDPLSDIGALARPLLVIHGGVEVPLH